MIQLTNENFEKETRGHACVIDFWATWCPPCKMMIPVFEEMSKQYAGYKFCKVNTDDVPELAETFDISAIPTFVLFENGNVTARAEGSMKAADLSKALGLKGG